MCRNLAPLLVLVLLLAAGNARAQIVTAVDDDTSIIAPSESTAVTDSDSSPPPANTLPTVEETADADVPGGTNVAEATGPGGATRGSRDTEAGNPRSINRYEDLRDYIAPGRRNGRSSDNRPRLEHRGSVHRSRSDPLHQAAHDPAHPTANYLDLRFHIEWGGAMVEWQGEISLDRGVMSRVDHLGVEPMAPGGWSLAETSVRFEQAAPRTYDAIALSVHAIENASLSFRLTTGDIETTRTIPLRDLINEPYGARLGASGRLTIRRAPGDDLRVRLGRSSMICNTSERVEMTVLLNAADNDLSVPQRCRLQLMNARSGRQVWSSELEASSNRQDTLGEIGPLTVPMPPQEGVYELIISVDPRSGSTALPAAHRRHTRRLQFVVLAKTIDNGGRSAAADAPPGRDWQVIQAIDPTFEQITGAASPLSIGSYKPREGETFGTQVANSRQIAGRNFATLGPGGWLAFPIRLGSEGLPHRVEVDYPGETTQQLGLAIVEPTADGEGLRTALDTGIDVSRLPDETFPEVATAETVFWPRSSRALLVVTNRSADEEAVVGSIRIQAGPDSLRQDQPPRGGQERLFAAKLGAAELTDLFGSGRVLDEKSGRYLTDWRTFWSAAEGLTELLRERGYNAAVIEVAGGGGALYPTALLPAMTRYDNGLLFTSGQDLLRKDVLELLFRIFDRQGLRLIPSVSFSTPLLALQRRADNGEEGLLLVDEQRQAWHTGHADAAVGPFYNPLSGHVQAAMQEVVSEILERYGDHESFAGVSLDLNRDTYARLPGANWAMDLVTVKRFTSLANSSHGAESTRGSEQQQPEVSARWLTWRAAELAAFYERMHRELTEKRPELQIFLAGDDLLRGLRPVQASPDRLPPAKDVATLLLEQGIAPEHFAKLPGMVLLRPLAANSAVSQGYDAEAAQTKEIVAAFLNAGADQQGGLLHTRARPYVLESERAAELLGVSSSQIRLRPFVGVSGARGSQPLTHLLASHDCESIFVRGLTRLRAAGSPAERVAELIRGLPAKPVSPPSHTPASPQAQPLTLRALSEPDKTQVYVANDSPWPIRATLTFGSATAYEITGFSTGERIVGEGEPAWQLTVPPYDVAHCTLSAPNVRVATVHTEHGEALTYMLETEIDRLERQLSRMRRWDVLKNASFETSDPVANVGEWRVSEGSDLRVVVVPTQAATGRQALLLQSRTPVGWSRGPVAWFRSQDLPTPSSRRLAMQVHVRVADAQRQPRVRLVVEGQAGGERFYRQTEYGGGEGLPRLGQEWQQVGILVDDLPEGEIRNLRVGVDLRGTGQIWVDDVQLFDVWLTQMEATQVSEQLRLASVGLSEGRLQDCRHALQRAGPQYLRHHFRQLLEAELNDAPSQPIRDRRQQLHEEIARLPAAVMTARPSARPAPREIRELQQVPLQEREPRRHWPDRNQEPNVLSIHRTDDAPRYAMPTLDPDDLRRLPPPQPTAATSTAATSTEERDAEAGADEQGGFSGWLNNIFWRKRSDASSGEATSPPRERGFSPASQPAAPPSSRRQNSLLRQFQRSRDENNR